MLKRLRATIGWLSTAAMLAAVTLQVMLPLALVGTILAAVDPLDHAVICAAASGDAASNNAPGAPAGNAHHCVCPVCHLAAGKPFAPAAMAAALPVPAQVATLLRLEPAQSAGPRGPPLDRPHARGPPSVG